MSYNYTFKLKDSATLPLTQKVIEEFAAMPGSITERPLNYKRVDYLRSHIIAGLGVSFNWAKAQIEGEKVWYRVNGQHSSHVVMELFEHGHLPEGLVAHLDSYIVPDSHALVQLFRQFDTSISSRSSLDVTNAYAAVVSNLDGIDREAVQMCLRGIWWYRQNILKEKNIPKSNDQLEIALDPQYHDFIRWLDRLLTKKTPEIRKKTVAAAAWATYQIAPANAEVFWARVAVGKTSSTDKPTDPATVLDSFLLEDRPAGCKGGSNLGDIYQGCIYAWNAYAEGESITKIAAHPWNKKGYLTPKIPENLLQMAAE